MWSKYLEREDSKIVGKWACAVQAPAAGAGCWLPLPVADAAHRHSRRPVCGAAEELADLQPLRLLLHCLRPLLGPVSAHRQGDPTSPNTNR